MCKLLAFCSHPRLCFEPLILLKFVFNAAPYPIQLFTFMRIRIQLPRIMLILVRIRIQIRNPSCDWYEPVLRIRIRDSVPFWPLAPGSRIPNLYFWELSDKFLGKKFYNSLKIGPHCFSISIIKYFSIQWNLSLQNKVWQLVDVLGSGMGKNQDPGSGIRDEHLGSATLVWAFPEWLQAAGADGVGPVPSRALLRLHHCSLHGAAPPSRPQALPRHAPLHLHL